MSESKKLELTAPVAIVVCGVIIAGAIVFVNRFPAVAAPTAQAPQGGTYANVDVSAPSDTDHRYGSANAPIVLIEYSDFQCPFCARVHTTLKQVVDESNGEVAWVYRHLPLESIHPQARPGAIASECVAVQLGNEGFWAFADAIFANQGQNQQSLSPQFFAAVAGELGINPIAYNTCVASGTYEEKIDAEASEATAAGGQGTPFTVVYGNGAQVAVSGAVPIAQFKSVINKIMARQ